MTEKTPKCTALLVFIHGFKGDDTTFSDFPQHLISTLELAQSTSASTSLAGTDISFKAEIYPAFETRGSLPQAVENFNKWLLDKVIDIEVAQNTSSPMVNPGVDVILCGHSMGGIVAVEAVRTLSQEANEKSHEKQSDIANISSEVSTASSSPRLFPNIIGVVAFDTPYLGIEPGVVKYGAEDHIREGKGWYNTAQGFFAGGKAMNNMFRSGEQSATSTAATAASGNSGAATAASTAGDAATETMAKSNWSKYGKTALIASGAAATLAVGTAAYMKRNQIQSSVQSGATAISSSITSGTGWFNSHMEFIGCLTKAEELRERLAFAQDEMRNTWGLGFSNFFTSFDHEDSSTGRNTERTFCFLPKQQQKWEEKEAKHENQEKQDASLQQDCWVQQRNDLVKGEIQAHCSMFMPKKNSGFEAMSDRSRDLILEWIASGRGQATT